MDLSKVKVGDRLRYFHSAYPEWVKKWSDKDGNPAIVEVVQVSDAGTSLRAKAVTGAEKGTVGYFLNTEVEPSMKIVSVKRSSNATGLKVYGKVLGEKGKVHNFAYIRRPNFRGWICSCENFFFEMFKKNRNCKHLHFVRNEIGRFGAKVPKS